MIRLATIIKGKQLKLWFLLFITLGLFIPALDAQPIGATFSNPIVIGTYGQGSYSYSDTKNNSTSNGYQNNMGQTSDDIYYKITVQAGAQLNISLCSSTFDTYLHLLNSTGTILFSNDDNGPLCTSMQSSIQTTVTAGTYYIVTEGYSSNSGNLVLSVNSVVEAPVVINTRNYIKVWEAVAPETNPNTLMTKDVKDVKHSVQYFDGLGRPEQTVVKKGSLSDGVFGDMVKPNIYDAFGREVQQYLPYISGSTNGLYKDNVLTEQNNFYTGTGSPIYGQGETVFYGYTKFESSPLNRVEEVFAPGTSWAGTKDVANEADRRSVKMKYWINTPTDAVRIWNVTDITNSFGSYTSTASYNAGELFKNVTIDEHGKQVIEFKDKEGKVVLKKVQLTATAETNGSTGSNHNGWLCTYYIYDDLNNLRCVIQPKGVELISPNWLLTDAAILAEQCFRYEYDQRNRMIMKKVPGAGEVYMVYDARDRLVMMQDANMRASNKWMLTFYDQLNRPQQTGLLLNTWDGQNKTFSQHRDAAYSSTSYPFSIGSEPSTTYWEMFTKTGYDNYTSIPGGSGLNNSFDGSWSANFHSTYNTAPYYAQQQVSSNATTGMVTWTQTKVLGTSSQYLYNVIIYDDKGRAIQIKSKNISGETDVTTTQYSWNGVALVSVQKNAISGSNAQTHTVVTKMEYDDLWRVAEVKKKINTGSELVITKNQYDKLGQLKNKEIGKKKNPVTGSYTNDPIETLNYDYNIRGWLLGANRNYVKDVSTNYFGFELAYDKTVNIISGQAYVAPQFNGNITGTTWKSAGDTEKRKFDFTYDAVNRLTGADFNQYTSSAFNKDAGINFSISNLTFDANGNILSMDQKGWKLTGSTFIDQMTYAYIPNTNKLLQVTDAVNDNTSKLGDFKYDANTKTGTDYNYDVNGNLTLDNNKKISSIVYNYLNLPSVITMTGKGTITYIYDGGGNKLKKVTVETASATNNNITTTTTTTYLGGFVYESKADDNPTTIDYTDKLQFTGHEEGRIRVLYDNSSSPGTITGYAYDYMLKDHLGNVRMLLTDEVKQDVYPAATLENASYNGGTALSAEKKFYTIDETKVVLNSEASGITTYQNNNGNPPYNNNTYSNATANSEKVYKLNASTNKTGLGIALKVMAGDVIYIFGKSYHKKPVGGYTTPIAPLIVSEILSAFTGTSAILSKGITGGQISGQSGFPTTVDGLVGNRPDQTTEMVKASINWILFDEQFKFTGGGHDPVGAEGGVKTHNLSTIPAITVTKSGYIYVYCSDESEYNVFFDNLQVIHNRGPILEETHYYPGGLVMQGISSKALPSNTPNRIKFNGIEQNNDFDLNMYDAFYRNLDPQIGRFWQIDPEMEAQESNSPYESMGNNPILNVDPLGDFKTRFGAWWNSLWNGGEVHKNKYGEWYVSKTTGSNDGSYSSTTTITYGKGRNQYSNAIAFLSRQYEIADDIQKNGENSMYTYYESGKDAGNAALSYTGVVSPSPILQSGTIAINTSRAIAAAQKMVEKLLNAGRTLDKGGLTAAGRALQKHGGRTGSVFPKATGNPTAVNKQGETILSEIIKNPSVTTTTRHHARFGNILEYKLPNGQGARFSADGSKFIGFIEH